MNRPQRNPITGVTLLGALALGFSSVASAATVVNTPVAKNTANAATNVTLNPAGASGKPGTVTQDGQLSGTVTPGELSGTASNPYGTSSDEPADEICECTASYSDGTEEVVGECERSECPDLERYNTCRDAQSTGIMPIGGCRLLEACACDCWPTEPRIGHDYGDDVFLSGVPNLWQFDYACGFLGKNAVGCGPVAAAMVTYYLVEQGFDSLVSGAYFNGSTPATATHDWQELVKTFRDDYLDGGICWGPSGQYATLQTTMRNGIEDFIEDAGYPADVDHYKVCDDCNRNEPEELDPQAGLSLIRDELTAGRPVIMGFNAKRATETDSTFEEDGTDHFVFTGRLSNGGDGWIDHYAVVTGYRNIAGRDVVYVNMGLEYTDSGEPSVDQPFLWNPGGEWLHLYTVDIPDEPEGDDWCVIDNGIDLSFFQSEELDASFEAVDVDGDDLADPPVHLVAGASCGIHRTVSEYEYWPHWSGVTFECDPYAELEQDLEQMEQPFGDADTTGHGDPGGSYGPPIVEWIPPPGL